MSHGQPPLASVLAAIDQVERSLRDDFDPVEVAERLRLVQEVVARLPHKYLAAATAAELAAAERVFLVEGRSRRELKQLGETLTALFDQLIIDRALRYHPLRAEDRERDNTVHPPEVGLAVEIPEAIAAAVGAAIAPLGLSLHAEPTTARAVERARWFPFRFVIAAFPVDAPARFLEVLRGPTSLCRSTGVVLLAADSQARDAEIYLGRGANRVVPLSHLAERLGGVVTELDQVCERVRIRLPITAEIDGGRRVEQWRSENISRTGMLLRTPARLQPGPAVGLRFTVPGQERPIQVSAEAVRATTFAREEFDGLGVRFLSFSGDGQYRLERFLG